MLAAGALQAQTGNGNGDGLEELLAEVGKEYAKAYLTPLVNGWGANQNSGLFHTAAIPRSRLSLSIGVKVMGAHLNEKDQTFRRVLHVDNLNDYLDLQEGDLGYAGRGAVVLEGPTVIGDPDAMGTITGYYNGIPVGMVESIEGLVQTRWIPLVAPELQVGGLVGLRASLRWLPEIDLGEFGKTKYMGWGLQWSPGFLLPALPVDVTVGFFRQDINLGTIIETAARSVFLAASKSFTLVTVYGGLASESSTMRVSYERDDEEQTAIDFEIEGVMNSRLTAGVTLNLGASLNAEVGVGKLVVYTAGLMFCF